MSVCFKFNTIQSMVRSIQSINIVAFLKSLLGTTIFTANILAGEKIEYRINYIGLLFVLLWYGLYFYCSFVSYDEGQTILRLLYDTKLKQYGDSLQDALTFLYSLFLMWKIPFDLNKSIRESREFAHIDKPFDRLSQTVNTDQISLVGLIVILIQVALCGIKMWAMWMILRHLEASVPWNKMYDVVYVEILMLTIVSYYCLYLMMVKARYRTVNKILRSIKEKYTQECYIVVRERRARSEMKSLQMEEKYVCEKIKICANIVSMLYESTDKSNKKYGVALVFTMIFCLVTITLNLFYLMEATAAGLFYDASRYCAFLVYVFWHIIMGVAVIYVIVCLCELTVAEAKATGFVVHEIINNNVGTAITSEAMQLSLQLLHQIPVFTARGLYKLDYLLILEGARSVVTFLVMLIQFVTDPPSPL